MSKRGKNRGVTLYELVIVMLLTALIGGLVLSFSAFLTDYIGKADKLSASVYEVTSVKRAVERWFSHYDSEEYVFELKETNVSFEGEKAYRLQAASIISGECYAIEFSDESGGKTIRFAYPDGNSEMAAETIDLITFNHLQNSAMYRCEIRYGGNTLRFLLVERVK